MVRARVKRLPRLAAAVVTTLAMTLASPRVAPAEDTQSAAADLAHAGDFRVRVSAALLLGRTRPTGARTMLEHALDDAHAAVRTAAAAALASIGDPAAIPALDRHAKTETSGSARAQMQTTIATLSRSGDAPSPTTTGHSHSRYAVALGHMKNMTGVRGGELSNVLRDAARLHAHSLPGAVVYDEDDADAPLPAKLPVLLLEGQITRMAQAQASGAMRIEARVEFSVKREPQQTLKGTLSGGATAVESLRTLSSERLIELQNQTVDNAVESALRGADSGLALAAK
jgi:hypothetical protein